MEEIPTSGMFEDALRDDEASRPVASPRLSPVSISTWVAFHERLSLDGHIEIDRRS